MVGKHIKSFKPRRELEKTYSVSPGHLHHALQAGAIHDSQKSLVELCSNDRPAYGCIPDQGIIDVGDVGFEDARLQDHVRVIHAIMVQHKFKARLR